jgi:hypothetical protein
MEKFTEEDIMACWPMYADDYFLQVLNGEYDLQQARDDLKSQIGSRFDPRTNGNIQRQVQDDI